MLRQMNDKCMHNSYAETMNDKCMHNSYAETNE